MAASAVIGALRVNLGLDSASFEKGLKESQANLAKFGKVVAVGFAAATTAAVAAGTAMGVAVKGAIDNADAMSKAAQKIGVTTEALSRLKYAADFSDVSLEQLTTGLGRLSKTMLDVSTGSKGPAATAFRALGIAVTDAAGNLRNSDVVFADIADRFSRMEDGATKTALAISLFGRAGAEMIPLLNSGKDGLAAMGAESDKLGLTISTRTGKAAEQFNDTLTKIGKIMDGVVNKVMTAALPALQSLAEQLASPELAAAAANFGVAIVEQLSAVIEWLGKVETRWAQFVEFLNTQGRKKVLPLGSTNIEDRSTPGWLDRQRAAGDVVDGSFNALGSGKMFGSVADMWEGMKPGGGLPTFSDSGAADAMENRLEALRQSLMTEEQLEIDSHAKRLAEIASFYEQGAIKKAEHDSLIEGAQRQHGEKMAALAQEQADKEAAIRDSAVSGVANIFGSLSKLAEQFGEKNLAAAKAFGIAEAVVNTAQGITKALTLPPPLSWIQAGAVAAAGAAQIATIASTSKGSGSKPSVSGTSAAATPVAPAVESSRAVNITFQGLGRSGMEQFVRELNDAIGDGVTLNLNPA